MKLDDLQRLEAESHARLATERAFRDGWSAALRLIGARSDLLKGWPVFPFLLDLRRDDGARWVGVLRCPFLGKGVDLSSAEAVILALLAERLGHVITARTLAELRDADVPAWMRPVEPFGSERTVRKYVARLRKTLARGRCGKLVESLNGQCGGYRLTRGVSVFQLGATAHRCGG